MTPRCGSLLPGGVLFGHHLPIEPSREGAALRKAGPSRKGDECGTVFEEA